MKIDLKKIDNEVIKLNNYFVSRGLNNAEIKITLSEFTELLLYDKFNLIYNNTK